MSFLTVIAKRCVSFTPQNQHLLIQHQHRTLGTSGSRLRPRIRKKRSPARVRAIPSSQNQNILGPYGLTRVDYSKPPPAWPLPPPPPPKTNPIRRYMPQAVAGIAFLIGTWIYFTRDDQVYEYWKQVEQGVVPVDYDDEEDEED